MKFANATNLNRKSGGANRGICCAPFVCPAPTGPQPPRIIPNPHGKTNLRVVIPGFQEWSAEPQIPPRHAGTGRLRSPGFPVEIGGVVRLHAPFLTREAHTQPVHRSVGSEIRARDDKKERVVARKGRLLNRGIFQNLIWTGLENLRPRSRLMAQSKNHLSPVFITLGEPQVMGTRLKPCPSFDSLFPSLLG